MASELGPLDMTLKCKHCTAYGMEDCMSAHISEFENVTFIFETILCVLFVSF